MNMNLKEFRKKLNITLAEASKATSVPLRTYIRYENDEKYGNNIKRYAIIDALNKKYSINENKGIYQIEEIKTICNDVFLQYEGKIKFCYLFGSYSKGYASETSDIDLLIDTDITGLEFIGLIENLHTSLHKEIDLIRLKDLQDNINLIEEVMKDGIKIYG